MPGKETIESVYNDFTTSSKSNWRLRRILKQLGLEADEYQDEDGHLVRDHAIEGILVKKFGEEEVDKFLQSLESGDGPKKETDKKTTTKSSPKKSKPDPASVKPEEVESDVDPDDNDDSEPDVDPDDEPEKETEPEPKPDPKPKGRQAIKKGGGKKPKKEAENKPTNVHFEESFEKQTQHLERLEAKLDAAIDGMAVLRKTIESQLEEAADQKNVSKAIIATLDEGFFKIGAKLDVKKMRIRLQEAREKVGYVEEDSKESE